MAACIDGLDGRLARLLKATSRFGAEFDSLADFLCFGVAPALVLYLWSLERWRGFGYIPCLMFAVCMALRLARFNASLDSSPSPAYAYNFFTGVPAPAGAGLVLFPLFLGLEARALGMAWLQDRGLPGVLRAGADRHARRCWSRRCRSGASRTSRCAAEYVLPTLLGVGCFAALLVADPWAALAARRADLSRHAAVQPAQLPPPARGGGRRGAVTPPPHGWARRRKARGSAPGPR